MVAALRNLTTQSTQSDDVRSPNDPGPSPETALASGSASDLSLPDLAEGRSGLVPVEPAEWSAKPSVDPSADLSAAACADRLMDDLFGDLERSLEGCDLTPEPEPAPETVALQTAIVPALSLPPSVLPPPKPVAPDPEKLEAIAEVKRLKTKASSLDRWIVGGGLVVLAGTVVAWLINHQIERSQAPLALAPLSVSRPAPIEPGAPAADEAFAAYLQRSLATIQRREEERPAAERSALDLANKLASGTAVASAGSARTGTAGPTSAGQISLTPGLGSGAIAVQPLPGGLPAANPGSMAGASLPLTGNVIDLLNRLAVLLERGQLPSGPIANRAAAPIPGNRPGSNNPTTDRRATAPPLLGPDLPASAVNGDRLAANSNPNSNSGPNGNRANPDSLPQTQPSVAVLPPAPVYSLVGLLELGDRSAALVSIDGSTRRVSVGEAIGSSGWTLVEVANQQAKVRRNGEVKTLYVGQTF